jgi:AcrR family transcriptional regulator
MNDKLKFTVPSMPPLPSVLTGGLVVQGGRPGKRERTRLQLAEAAIQVFSARGVAGSTIQEIAEVAGMTTGTVYNHFATKEEVLMEVVVVLAQTLCERIAESYPHVAEGAERMAIGQRRYIWLAEASPAWALLLLDVSASAPQLLQRIQKYSLADLRLGVKQKSFKLTSEAAALDLINGAGTQAMLRVALGQAPANHGIAVATMVLRGLGMSADDAAAVARRPLPAFPEGATQAAIASPARKSRRRGVGLSP